MGCVSSRLTTLEKMIGEPVTLKNDVSSASTKIYISESQQIWKVCHANSKVIRQTFMNNYRVKSMPECKFVVRPEKLIKVDDSTVAIGMKYVNMDLYNYVREPFDLERVLNGLEDISQAIQWMHDKNLAHRDIKPENIVLDTSHFYLIDFDFTSPLENYVLCGTKNYVVSSEIVSSWQCTKSEASMRNDVYAFGKTILFVLCAAASFNVISCSKQECKTLFHCYKSAYIEESTTIILNHKQALLWCRLALECCRAKPPVSIPLHENISTTLTT